MVGDALSGFGFIKIKRRSFTTKCPIGGRRKQGVIIFDISDRVVDEFCTGSLNILGLALICKEIWLFYLRQEKLWALLQIGMNSRCSGARRTDNQEIGFVL